VIDPTRRWGPSGEKPDFAGLLTYGGAPYSEDPKDLERSADIAIVGAPMDDLVSDRPGTRFGPRAIRAASCPPGPHLEAKLDAFSELRIIDYGDAPVVPADPRQSHQAIQSIIDEVVEAGAIPIVLGGDHSITEPEITALARHHGPLGLVHFDTHTDTGAEVFGAELSHGTPMFKLVENGLVDPSRYVQIGLRGYWPGETEFGWQSSHGITSLFMHEIRELGIAAIVERAAPIAAGTDSDQPVFLSVDVDVLDPAFAPGTGTPEPGGLTSSELLWAVRKLSERCRLVGGDVVEVAPTSVGGADVTALIADRVVREALTGIALRRRAASETVA
jgi:agmatinase